MVRPNLPVPVVDDEWGADLNAGIYQVSDHVDNVVASPRISFGPGSLAALAVGYNVTKSIVSLGRDAMTATTACRYAIAIGPGAMSRSTINRDDIAIGESALRQIQATTPDYSQSDLTGTRMIAIGGNAGLFATTNYNEVLVGRNASQCKTSGTGLVAIGANAVAGNGQYGLQTPADGGDIINNQPWGSDAFCRTVAVGANALNKSMALEAVAIGGDALANCKASNWNVALGTRALMSLDTGTGYKGGTYTTLGTTGTYSQSSTTITITITAHGLAVGNWVYVQLTSGASATFGTDQAVVQVVAVLDANAFTITSPMVRSATGNVTLVGKETTVAAAFNESNTAVGADAGAAMLTSSFNTLVGKGTGVVMTAGGWNTFLGASAGGTCTSTTNNVAVGFAAYGSSPGGGGNVAVGASALRRDHAGVLLTTSLANAVGVGRDSSVIGDGGVAVGYATKATTNGVAVGNGASTGAFLNATAVGNGAVNTAANQVQLGNDTATGGVRAFGAYVNASDVRDKTDIEDTTLGLEFINRLRPVDYRLRPRATGEVESRVHHGLIAQEVQDAGGFSGVIDDDPERLALAYSELVAPLIKAVQDLSAEVAELKARYGA